jgi:hypothetical protein
MIFNFDEKDKYMTSLVNSLSNDDGYIGITIEPNKDVPELIHIPTFERAKDRVLFKFIHPRSIKSLMIMLCHALTAFEEEERKNNE